MDRLYIGIYGSVNSGKSSLINKITGQDIALVSEQEGTTTDPVKKIIELDGIGPAVLIDTAGLNDKTPLGQARVAKTLSTLPLIDLAIVVASQGQLTEEDKKLIAALQVAKTPFFIINNKSDLATFKPLVFDDIPVISFSSLKAENVKEILSLIKQLRNPSNKEVLLDDIIKQDDIIVLVAPIDSAAPKGRLILPQVNTIRNILDNRAISVVLQVEQLAAYLKKQPEVKLVITDSQAFKEVNQIVPKNIPLTSFSILFARLKGDFKAYLNGAKSISQLQDGDKVLILESCTHSAITCEDIGRVKLPKLIEKKSGKKLNFKIIPGLESLPEDLASYKLVVQCGGCMVTRTQLIGRISQPLSLKIPTTNYGMAIAYSTGILDRVVEIF